VKYGLQFAANIYLCIILICKYYKVDQTNYMNVQII